jgi:5-methylcytosine-specific restriction endonuclease McrA
MPEPGSRLAPAPWQSWYSSAWWKAARHIQLMKEPLCAECQRSSPPIITAANTVHHKTPHKGSRDIFFDADQLESLCAHCHNSIMQARERGARSEG